MTPQDTPLLQVIFSRLEPLINSPSDSIRKPSLEARLIITARSTYSATASPQGIQPERKSDQETYREAIKLVQDPILPVRAHGLLMLRQMVVPPRTSAVTHPELDRALIPGILDVFMQCVQDDDSFVFLNAVQGLAAMVDRLGRDILQRLLGIYFRGAETGGEMGKAELDKRLRIAEALGHVIRRCGDALNLYGESFI